jgi:hypothetical protein
MFGEPQKMKDALAEFVNIKLPSIQDQTRATINESSIDPEIALLKQRLTNIENFIISLSQI